MCEPLRQNVTTARNDLLPWQAEAINNTSTKLSMQSAKFELDYYEPRIPAVEENMENRSAKFYLLKENQQLE